jgi:flagellar hook-length control protein FliK
MEFTALPIVPGNTAANNSSTNEAPGLESQTLESSFEKKFTEVKNRSNSSPEENSRQVKAKRPPKAVGKKARAQAADSRADDSAKADANEKPQQTAVEDNPANTDKSARPDSTAQANDSETPRDQSAQAGEYVAEGATLGEAASAQAAEVIFELAKANNLSQEEAAILAGALDEGADKEGVVEDAEGAGEQDEDLGDFTQLVLSDGGKEGAEVVGGLKGGEALNGQPDSPFAEKSPTTDIPGIAAGNGDATPKGKFEGVEQSVVDGAGAAGAAESAGVEEALANAVGEKSNQASERGLERREEPRSQSVDPAEAKDARQRRGGQMGQERSGERSESEANNGWQLNTEKLKGAQRADGNAVAKNEVDTSFQKLFKTETSAQKPQAPQLAPVEGSQAEKSSFDTLEFKPAVARNPLMPAPLGRQVSDAVRLAIMNRGDRAVLQLKPEALGRVQVDLIREAEGISARIQVENAHAHQALSNDLDQLKENFASKGVNLIDVQVELRERDTQEGHADQKGKKGNNNLRGDDIELSELPDTEITAPHWQPWGFEVRA